ncbi:hypothetical protein [uncultured Cocleimonas sp.]|uniref:hypothetical protein n=1 Tax=uncultured Cocleimonas sp. TaxID=1051587 RepID=UPI0026348B8B|nr:hypothetical protein [uncultured Cocleimonas sp.]
MKMNAELVFINLGEVSNQGISNHINALECNLRIKEEQSYEGVTVDAKRNIDASLLIDEFDNKTGITKDNKVLRIVICKYSIKQTHRWFYQKSSNTLLISLTRLESLDVGTIATIILSAYYCNLEYDNLSNHSGDCCFNLKTHQRVTSSICDNCNNNIGDDIYSIQNIMNSCCNVERPSKNYSSRQLDGSSTNESHKVNSVAKSKWAIFEEWWFRSFLLALIIGSSVFIYTSSYPISTFSFFLSWYLIYILNPKRRYFRTALFILGILGLGGTSIFSGKFSYSEKLADGDVNIELAWGEPASLIFVVLLILFAGYLVWLDNGQK